MAKTISLDERIKGLEFKLSEFCEADSIKAVKRNSDKVGLFIWSKFGLHADKRGGVNKIVYFSMLDNSYRKCWEINNKRSNSDKLYPFKTEKNGIKEEQFELRFPINDTFFRDGYKNPLFLADKDLDINQAREYSINYFQWFKERYELWKSELNE
ncbi:hypothetical protein HYX16_05410 [Candidatus Woesearchaeota archaeon]|nr:hypothetical protein [Candidatus Woesearchaeota archaeon]